MYLQHITKDELGEMLFEEGKHANEMGGMAGLLNIADKDEKNTRIYKIPKLEMFFAVNIGKSKGDLYCIASILAANRNAIQHANSMIVVNDAHGVFEEFSKEVIDGLENLCPADVSRLIAGTIDGIGNFGMIDTKSSTHIFEEAMLEAKIKIAAPRAKTVRL